MTNLMTMTTKYGGDDIVIDEQVYYQGGERIENDGGEEAWSTDDEADDMDFEDDSAVSRQPIGLDYDGDIMMGNPSAGKDAEPINEDKKSPRMIKY